MRKVKKGLCLLMVMLFALTALLAGCGEKNEPAGSENAAVKQETPQAQEGEEKSDVPEEHVELTWYLVGNRQEPDTELVCQKANEYLKDKLNVSIKLTTFGWGDPYETKLQPMLAAGEPFDICFTANWILNYRVNASLGAFYPLNGFLEKYPKIKEILGEDFLEGSAINGKNYALPTNKEKAHNWGFILKKDLVEKYNVPVEDIKKMEDLEPYFEEIKKNEQGVYPLLVVNMEAPFKLLDWDKFSDDDIPGALYPDNRDTKVINEFEAPESIAMFKKMREYYNKGYIHPDAATQQNFEAELKTGKYFAAVQSLKPGKDAEMTNSTGIEWVQVDITKPVMSNRETTGAMLAISAASRHPERAFRFIEMLYTDKYLKNLFDFGIEGKHYVKVSDNVIEYAPETEGGTKSGYNPGNGWKYGNQFLDYLFSNEDPNKWQKFEEFNKKALPLRSLGFVFNGESIATQASACKNIVQSYYKLLFTGSVDPEVVLPKMNAELKAAGVDDIIQEMQRQYDEWLEKTGKK